MKNRTYYKSSFLIALLFFTLIKLDAQTSDYFNGFEVSVSPGWDAFGGPFTPTRVASGTNDITSADGDFHATVSSNAATNFGGYHYMFPDGGFSTSLDIYLDVNAELANDSRFDYTCAINNSVATHRRDFVFNVGFYNDATGPGANTNRFVVSASNNAGRANAFPKNPGRSPIALNATGWYTFTHTFYDNGSGVLAVDLMVSGPGGSGSWTLSDPSDLIGETVGGNRYGWVANSEIANLAIDNSALTLSCMMQTWYEDMDDDGFGNPAVSITDCEQPDGYVADNTDCDDTNSDVNSSTSPELSNVVHHNTTSSTVYWTTIPGSSNYGIRYRPQGSNDPWTEANSLRAWRRLFSLSACTDYEVQFRNYKGGVWNCWSQNYYFTTTGCAKPFNGGVKSGDVSSIQLYPNPTNGSDVTVEISTTASQSFNWTLSDLSGKMLQSGNTDLTAGFNQITIKSADLPTGVYFFKAPLIDKTQVIRVIVK